MTLVEYNEERVAAVLAHEEKRKNWEFITRSATRLDAENKFAKNPILDALLITEHARLEDSLLGIITRWDILRLTK